MRRAWLLLLLSIATIALPLHADDPAPITDAEIAALIQQLTTEDFDLRQAASKRLAENLVRAEPALGAILDTTKDPELRSRLEGLIPTGAVTWTFEAGYLFGQPVVQDKHLYVANKDETFFCLDADSGEKIWAAQIGGLMFHSPAVGEGAVVTIRTRKDGRKDGTVFCLDADSGEERWRFRGRDSQTFTSPAISEGRIYFACEELLMCLSLVDGSKLWEFAADELLLSPPALKDGKVYVGGLDRKLHCVDAKTGKQVWEFETQGPVYAGATLAKDRVYFGSQDQFAYALDAATGKELWKFDSGGRINGGLALANETLYFGTDTGTFHALKAGDGTSLWNVKTNGVIYGPAAVASERIYFGSINNKLTLYCLETANGKTAWTFETKEAGYVWPVLTGRRLYVGYHSIFYALRTNKNGPPAWPMMSGNPARTGQ